MYASSTLPSFVRLLVFNQVCPHRLPFGGGIGTGLVLRTAGLDHGTLNVVERKDASSAPIPVTRATMNVRKSMNYLSEVGLTSKFSCERPVERAKRSWYVRRNRVAIITVH